MVSLRGETPAECGAEPTLGADTDHDGAWCAHDTAAMWT